MSKANTCPHCAQPVFRASPDGQKLKARTSMLVLHKGGRAEINCGSCGKGIIIPMQQSSGDLELRKALGPVPVVPKA